MPKHKLTELRVRSVKAKQKSYRLSDGEGLALWISPSGAKSWQLRYRLGGKEQIATLGKADRLSLSDARSKAQELRKLAEVGEQLTAHKHAQRAKRHSDTATTFGVFSRTWIDSEARRERWTADYKEEVEASLKNHLSKLDRLPISKITAAAVAPYLHAVERGSPSMFEKVRRRLRAILDHAVEKGLIASNPLPHTQRRKRMGERRHYPAVTALEPLGDILRAARASDPCKGVRRAHALLAFTAMRVSEVVGAKWDELELDTASWAIPRERMKRKDSQRGPHIVPIPPKLLTALQEWKQSDGTEAVYVCPAPRDSERPVTAEAIEKHYRNALKLAGKHSPHSWRSAFSTVCREAGKDGDVVEAQLDHVVGNKIASAYDRAQRLDLRRELLNWYEKTLIAARDGAAVLQMKSRSV